MLLISSRKSFWDSNELSETDEVRDVNLLDDSLGDVITNESFLNSLENKSVLMLIHGYNNEEDDVVRAYAIIEQYVTGHIPDQYDMVIGYTWPDGDDPSDYFSAKRRAGAVSRRVSWWLSDINSKVKCLDVMTHSMGSRVALLSVQSANKITIRNLFTMAAAVDNESIQNNEKFHSSTKLCKSVYVFHSKNDPVLAVPYRAAELDDALGLTGPEDPADIIENSGNVKVINSKNFIKEHGSYKTCIPVYSYINNELNEKFSRQFVTL